MKFFLVFLSLFFGGCVLGFEEIVLEEPIPEVFSEGGEDVVMDDDGYFNENYEFGCDQLDKFESVFSDEGIVMTRNAEAEVLVDGGEIEIDHYKVEIGAKAHDNFLDYADLTQFLVEEYPGFTYQFEGDGVYVDEGRGEYGVRHYYLMSDDGKVIYECYLKVPSQYYSRHKDGFEEFLKSFKLY